MRATLCVVAVLAVIACVRAQGSLAPLPASYFLLDEIPGTDFVGFGYNSRYEAPRNALTVPLLQFSYTQGKTYIYPADPSRTMRVPDELFSRTVAYTVADAYYYTSIDDYKKTLALSVGFSFERTSTTNNTQNTCVTSKDPTTNVTGTSCTTDAYSSNSNTFSVGANVQYLSSSLSDQQQYIVEQMETTQLYHIYLDTEAVRKSVYDAGKTCDAAATNNDVQTVVKFIEKYGTHYVAGAIMGGQVKATSNVQQTTTTATSDISAGADVRYVKAQEAMRTAKTSYDTQTIGAGVSVETASIDSHLQSQVTSSWLLLGGDSNVVDLLDYRNSAAAIKTWKTTITSNPVAVSYRLREISTLFADPVTRQFVSGIIKLYLASNATDSLINVDIRDTFFIRAPFIDLTKA